MIFGSIMRVEVLPFTILLRQTVVNRFRLYKRLKEVWRLGSLMVNLKATSIFGFWIFYCSD
jgi:hypothetical protein